jgi:hypothetical protein
MKTIKRSTWVSLFAVGVFLAGLAPGRAQEIDPYVGHWALTIPGGGAGWLGVTKEKGYYDASILWGGGSVVPVESVYVSEGVLYVTRLNEVQRKNAQGTVVRTHRFTETIQAKVNGDNLELTTTTPNANGSGWNRRDFTGKRIPPLPSKPDLSQVKFGDPISLFNGKDLTGWKLTNPNQANGWSAQNSVLLNRPVQEPNQPHKSYGNLRTEQAFEDFNLTLETRVEKGGNSGIYLRGIYEVQIIDSYGKPLDSHNMGAIYSRIKPTVSAEKPVGEWQSLDLTLVDRHVTVVLNGIKIIDNQPLLGCTGGALWADQLRPGPMYLQGDHTDAAYRNLVLRPVIK